VKTKVVTLVDRAAAAGGGERLACQVAARLDPARFESVLCATRPSDPDVLSALRADGVRVLALDRRSRASLAPWLRLVRFLRRERVDVLHAHKFGSNAWGAAVASVARVPVFIAHEHSWSFADDRSRLMLNRHLVGRVADAVIAVSELDRQRLAATGFDPARIALHRNGVPRPADDADPHALRRELGAGPHERLVGVVAGLRREKRVELLLDAVARLRWEGLPVRAVVIGDGPEEPRLRALAQELGLADAAFLGRRDDAARLVAGLDVAVLCSDREGCPLSLLEYMAAGRPVAATRVGGVPELARDGVEALLVPPGDAVALAAAIGRLLSDGALASSLGAAAARRQAEEFDLDEVVRGLEDLYERLLGRRAARTQPLEPLQAAAGGAPGHGRR
jgi:glycosyltransferase involved in cell wall biosynthesis